MRRAAASVAMALITVLLWACGPGSVAPSGALADMRVTNGRFIVGAFPGVLDGAVPTVDAAMTDGGDAGDVVGPPPTVHEVDSLNNSVHAGERGKALNGRVSSTALTVALGLQGDIGYWIVPVTTPDLDNPPDLDFAATLDFSPDLATGPRVLVVSAIDAQGRVGPAYELDLTVVPNVPMGDTVVSLTWNQNSDLDLFVVQPDGTTLSNRGVRQPNGMLVTGGSQPTLDLDSNAACVIDGTDQEDGVWASPMPGVYEVHVRMYDGCGVPASGWKVRLFRHGALVTTVSGISYASEVDNGSGGPSGPGQVALRFGIAE